MVRQIEDAGMPWIFSVDDHIQEPPSLWLQRIPDAYASERPRVVREKIAYVRSSGEPDWRWGDVWYYEEQRFPLQVEFTAADKAPDAMDSDPTTYDEMRPGCYRVADRLADMDLDHVDRSICFPNGFVRFCGQRFLYGKDKQLAAMCVRAYNDFLVEEWCGPSGGRLLGVGVVPLWDPRIAAEEVRRNAEKGLAAVAFSELPTRLGLPSLYSGEWDDLIAVCAETKTIICIHIGSSSTSAVSSLDAPLGGVAALCNFGNSALSLADWLLSGRLAAHPDLRIMFSEAQAGWLPYMVERADRLWIENYKHHGMSRDRLPELPSTYFHRQVFTCITDDPVAVRYINDLGSDNICFETDYPHPDGSFPNSEAVAKRLFAALSEENTTKVLRTNAEKLVGR
jgi:predicted TIM-barrel fold metal-dependent hydrolase